MSTATLRRTLKATAFGALRSSGVFSLSANSNRRQSRLLVLCYHGLSLRDEHLWAGHLFISPDRFRQRLKQLRDAKANVLPLGEALQRLQTSSLPPRSVAITFDDGFFDFLHHAVPILSDFAFPATLYLTTYYSGLRMPIINLVLDYILWKSGRERVDFPELGIPEQLPVQHWADRMQTVERLLAWCESQQLDTAAKDNFAHTMAQRFGLDYDDLLDSRLLQIMTPDEAVEVHKAGIDIQLHTHRHRTPLDRELFLREITDNSARITEITGRKPVHFCYPSGRYYPEFFPWLRESGVQSATTCERGFALPTSNPLLVPRVLDDSNMQPVEFEAVVAGLFA